MLYGNRVKLTVLFVCSNIKNNFQVETFLLSYKSLDIFQEQIVIKYNTELCMSSAKIIFDKITKLSVLMFTKFVH